MKRLIVNADDFGYSKIFNQEILKLIEDGTITSTTVMVDRVDDSQIEQIDRLVKLSKTKNLSIGLHTEFKDDSIPFREEIKREFKKFQEIFKFKPSHLDLHKSTYLETSYLEIQKFCIENNLPCRNHGIPNDKVLTTYKPVFITIRVDFSKIEAWIKSLEDGKDYEIYFHPGIYDPNLKSSFNEERKDDIENAKKLKGILEENNVELISFFDLK